MSIFESLDPDILSDDNELVLDPRLSVPERERWHRLAQVINDKSGKVLVPTSGTTGSSKLVVLSKRALQDSAAAVVEHLCAGTRDVWALALPVFHVGGLGILARSFLAASKLVKLPQKEGRPEWSAQGFVELCNAKKVTLSALVPTQVFDLVEAKLAAPASVRAIVVGGGALDFDLYLKARALGWRLLPSYGMTETASQVATASLRSLDEAPGNALPPLEFLPHAKITTDSDSTIVVQAKSLLDGYILEEAGTPRFTDPKSADGSFRTGDHGEILEVDGRPVLRVLGRGDDFVKINGERVDLLALDALLAQSAKIAGVSSAITVGFRFEPRKGLELLLLEEADLGTARDGVLSAFNAKVRPFERLEPAGARTLRRTELGKTIRRAP